MKRKIEELWKGLYPNSVKELDEVFKCLDYEKGKQGVLKNDVCENWNKNSVIYSLYVDLFAENFQNLKEKIPYLLELGINTIWILPCLSSPMRDQGFDIENYRTIRNELGTNHDFYDFINCLHKNGIRIIFDMGINHTSDQHQWFKNARTSKDAEYRDFYIFNKDTDKYKDARLIFKGMVNCNWEYNKDTDDYYFHRFYEFQPDLNYKNPKVLLEILKIFLYWQEKGVDGFRLDAIPFIWKEENTECENLKNVHVIIKIFRLCMDYVRKGTVFISEANILPNHVKEYFGTGDECQLAYHFPLMPKFFLAQAEKNYEYIFETLSEDITPIIPKSCEWISFLRCHDELTLEYATVKERELMNKYYLKDAKYSFREGEGIAGRLINLMDHDIKRVLNLYALLFSNIGVPIIYYGDEIGLTNDLEFFENFSRKTGYKDARFVNRGNMKWEIAEKRLTTGTKENIIFSSLKNLISLRKKINVFFDNAPILKKEEDKSIFRISRIFENQKLDIIINLSDENKVVKIEKGKDLITNQKFSDEINLSPFGYVWLLCE